MNFSLNGAKSLDQQTIMLRGVENAGHELLSIAPDLEKSPMNNAVFKNLPLGVPAPAAITLSSGNLPAGKSVVWMGVIFADGSLKPAIAFR